MTSAQLQQWWTALTPATRARLQLNPAGPVPQDMVAEALTAVPTGSSWPITSPGPAGRHLSNDAQRWITAGEWHQ